MKKPWCFISIDVEEDLVDGTSVLTFAGVEALESVLSLFEQYGVRATLFCTGRVLAQYSTLLKQFRAAGHEIAIHGYYDHVPMTKQSESTRSELLQKHISLYRDTFGTLPTGFRAVQNVIDEAGMKLLEDNGISYDSSLLSYYPIGKSYVGYSGPSPRELYHPDRNNIRREGNMQITEIPLVPLIGGVQLQGRWVSKLGPNVMKTLLVLKKPELLSYSFHSWDVLEPTFTDDLEKMLPYLSKYYTFVSGTELYAAHK